MRRLGELDHLAGPSTRLSRLDTLYLQINTTLSIFVAMTSDQEQLIENFVNNLEN